MATFDDHINNFPTGVRWAFAVTVSGLPYAWSTQEGLAISGFTSKPGGLCRRDFSFTFNAGVKNPIDTGKGIKIDLVDDDTGYLRQLFAPRYGSSTRQTREVAFTGAYAAGSTGPSLSSGELNLTLYVEDAQIASDGDYLYLGTETFRVDGSPVTSGDENFPVKREQFMSSQTMHKMDELNVGGIVSTSPRVFRGRWVEVYAAPVDDSGRATSFASGDIQKIWAGRLKSVSKKGHAYSLDVEPLCDVLSDKKPEVLAQGSISGIAGGGTGAGVYWDTSKPHTLRMFVSLGTYSGSGLSLSDMLTSQLVDPGDGVSIPAAGVYSGAQIVSILQYFFDNDAELGALSGGNPLKGKILVSYQPVKDSQGLKVMRFTIANKGLVDVYFGTQTTSSLLDFLYSVLKKTNFTVPAGGSFSWDIKPSIESIEETGGEVAVGLDGKEEFSASTYRFNDGDNGGGNAVGFVKLTSNGRMSICKVTAVSDVSGDTDQSQILRFVPVAVKDDNPWAFFDTSGDIKVEQILVSVLTKDGETEGHTVGNTDGVARLMLECLLSTGFRTDSSYSVSDAIPSFRRYDTMAYGHGYAIPERFIDIDGFLDAENRCGKFGLWLFYCAKSGNLKSDLSTMLKAAGLRLVTKRFGSKFGLSLSPIIPPAKTSYTKTIDDDFQVSSERPIVDYNERIIINLIEATDKTADIQSWAAGIGMDDFFQSYKVRYHLHTSQCDYGISEPLKLNMPVVLPQALGDMEDGLSEKMHSVAQRWFGSYGYGNYTVTITSPHNAWTLQPGDQVKMTLSLADSRTGTEGISDEVGVVESVTHNYGAKGGQCLVTLRSFLDYSYELAPCAKISSSSASGSDTAIVLVANEFSDATQGAIYEYHAGQSQQDVQWFDRAKHGEDIGIYIWAEGDWSNKISAEIKSTNVSTNTITINGQPTLPSGGSGDKYITLISYADSTISAFSKFYAYIADNNAKLGSADDDPKEWMA